MKESLIGYDADTVVRVTGVPYWKVDYWARAGAVVPSIRGRSGHRVPRLWSFEDIVKVRAVDALRRRGASLQKIRRAMDFLESSLGKKASASLFATDGETIFLLVTKNEAVDLLAGGQALWFLPIDSYRDEIRASLEKAAIA